MKFKTALVLAGGAFGTSIAFVLSHNFEKVIIMVRSQDIYDEINRGENTTYLPGQKLPDTIKAAKTWDEVRAETLGHVDLIVSGLPMSAIEDFCSRHEQDLKRYLDQGIPLVSLAKGIDHETLKLPDELFKTHFENYRSQLMYLSGPSFAKEIVDKQITIVSLAGEDKDKLLLTCEMLGTEFFKALPTTDVKGVLLGGALKNVIAIAGGIMEGLGYNHNTRAALITRGIVEMLRFGTVFGAKPETFYGPSGMGDLILTTTGELSRNKSFGIEIAKGRSPEEIIKATKSVVEGYKTTKAAYFLAQKMGIRARIFTGLYEVLYNNHDPKEVAREMMVLPPKFDEA
ncbi:NAD(P)H-dependent glycerol-3-phosphate dehydrogenase [Peredibacter sp. HCB2-198]|uniref:NAD(P)H-dependent glycerol-3-phosphate dehydrogenase n=1 Tax=Peredibacter sp. HCB2-198 TaxID=3383025 RepID=UPI0038B6923E